KLVTGTGIGNAPTLAGVSGVCRVGVRRSVHIVAIRHRAASVASTRGETDTSDPVVGPAVTGDGAECRTGQEGSEDDDAPLHERSTLSITPFGEIGPIHHAVGK